MLYLLFQSDGSDTAVINTRKSPSFNILNFTTPSELEKLIRTPTVHNGLRKWTRKIETKTKVNSDREKPRLLGNVLKLYNAVYILPSTTKAEKTNKLVSACSIFSVPFNYHIQASALRRQYHSKPVSSCVGSEHIQNNKLRITLYEVKY